MSTRATRRKQYWQHRRRRRRPSTLEAECEAAYREGQSWPSCDYTGEDREKYLVEFFEAILAKETA